MSAMLMTRTAQSAALPSCGDPDKMESDWAFHEHLIKLLHLAKPTRPVTIITHRCVIVFFTFLLAAIDELNTFGSHFNISTNQDHVLNTNTLFFVV